MNSENKGLNDVTINVSPYSLFDKENYLSNNEIDIEKVLEKFNVILTSYIIYSYEVDLAINNKEILHYLLERGIDTISHVFNILLLYTRNLDLVVYHCDKSLYFFIEFVSQISQEDRSFLQLTSRDACTYVYKKTIFDLNADIKKKLEIDKSSLEKLTIIQNIIVCLKIVYLKIIKIGNRSKDNLFEISEQLKPVIKKFNELISIELNVDKLTQILYLLSYKIEDSSEFIKQLDSLIEAIKLKKRFDIDLSLIENQKDFLNLNWFNIV
jgi:hypothetical protein